MHYRLLDGDVVVEANTGIRSLPLLARAVADFYAEFVAAAAQLGVPAPDSTMTTEIAGAAPPDVDHLERPWDPAVARLTWAALSAADDALRGWQASYRGHRPRVGLMWGGFDLSATYTGKWRRHRQLIGRR